MSKQNALKEKWQQHLQSWRDSGLSQSAWCKQSNVKPHQLWYWKRKLDQSDTAPVRQKNKASSFIPVIPNSQAEATAPAISTLRVTLPNRLTVTGFDQINLKLAQKLIAVLQ